jgi:hypothetical protein
MTSVVDDQTLEERLVRGFGDFDVALGPAASIRETRGSTVV